MWFRKITMVLFLGAWFVANAFAIDIAVIVNKANTEKMTPESIRNYFILSTQKFKNAEQVIVIDHAADSSARMVFLDQVALMNTSSWDQHWQELKSKRGTRKPNQAKSMKFILRYVSRRAGAISYVDAESLDARSRKLIRVVATFSK